MLVILKHLLQIVYNFYINITLTVYLLYSCLCIYGLVYIGHMFSGMLVSKDLKHNRMTLPIQRHCNYQPMIQMSIWFKSASLVRLKCTDTRLHKCSKGCISLHFLQLQSCKHVTLRMAKSHNTTLSGCRAGLLYFRIVIRILKQFN